MKKFLKKQLKIFVLIIFICSIYLILTLQIVNSQKIAWGVKVDDLHLGGKNISSAEKLLAEKWEQFIQQKVKLVYQDKIWLVDITELGFQPDYQTTINQAEQIGHHSNPLVNIKEQLIALFGFRSFSAAYQINQEKFQEQTGQLFENIERPTQNATLIFNSEINDYSLQHSTQGVAVNREQLINNLKQQINTFTSEPINLELFLGRPEVENNEVDSAKQKAQKVLANQPYYLTFEGEKYEIDKTILIDWIIFEPIKEEDYDNLILGFNLDIEKVKKYLDRVASKVDQPVTNAQLKTERNKAIIFAPDQPGFEVKKEQTFDNLVKNILADPPIKTTAIIADKALPKIKLWETNQLGIKKLIGQGISSFAGSPANRKHNIKTTVNKLNGYILNPNEEFSFNAFLGETGPEQGYKAELVIKKDKTTPEYGGGVCQVSTTFFRAAINTGLKITERQHHAFPVVYYNPQGFDATVYDPKPDLRFVNNTPNHLLIQASIQGSQVIVNFYGTDDNRQIKIKGPYILESNEDGSMKAVLTQEVYKLSGEELEKQTFYSNYKSPDLYPIETEKEE